ncbi:carbon-nitrogen family hydrolase [Halobacillus amylolyticus]|uniref:Carbon-nitrogen family hydrolase n=1 Tax=Halobacillus amylolyticus TaxID=2932259 RepID=A0ABY4H7C2_9BACI|nr:carbon-nitrogen family hydrolase [Halobacillus amylolyticus]UOR10377.1 carbon-nitrogen family hydrolase [Halobacillus amylolyticus]
MTTNLAIIQMDIAYGDPAVNRRQARTHIKEAVAKGGEVILLPEMWTTGYDLSRFDEIAETLDGPTHQLLAELAENHQVTIASSIAEREGEDFYNTFVVYDKNGECCMKYRKAHLFRLMDEEKYLKSGDQQGNFQLGETPVAGVICYDIRFPEWIRTHMLEGARGLFVVAEWPKSRVAHWRNLLISRAIENQCFVIACNRVGADPNNEFGGHSIVVDPWGTVVGEAGENEEILMVEVDFSRVEAIREQIPIFQDRRPDLYK